METYQLEYELKKYTLEIRLIVNPSDGRSWIESTISIPLINLKNAIDDASRNP